MSESDESGARNEYIVQLARLGMTGRSHDVLAYVRRIAKRAAKIDRGLAEGLTALLADSSVAVDPTREASPSFAPVDADSRLALLRQEAPDPSRERPILDDKVASQLDQIIAERARRADLTRAGLEPARSVLFVGPPGVGKTMSARWLAAKLNRTLLTLDLATVMSSYLGKTGSNLRSVLEYAKTVDCILFLDEVDAIAKRRNDDSDVGELKRLVTVMLQEIDDWPTKNLLVAATNHEDLLDNAIWRRFDEVIFFPMPDRQQRSQIIETAFGDSIDEVRLLVPLLVDLWSGESSSNIVRTASWVRRRAAIGRTGLIDALLEAVGRGIGRQPIAARKEAIKLLARTQLSDRMISRMTGVSRDTLRKYRDKAIEESD